MKNSLIPLQKIFCAGNDEHTLLGSLPLAFLINRQTGKSYSDMKSRLFHNNAAAVCLCAHALQDESWVSSHLTRLNTPAAQKNRDKEFRKGHNYLKGSPLIAILLLFWQCALFRLFQSVSLILNTSIVH